MVRKEEAEILKERALRMLNASEKHLSSGDYDLAVFLAEQSAQLFLKYKVFNFNRRSSKNTFYKKSFTGISENS